MYQLRPIPCWKRELSLSRARTRSPSTDPTPDDGRRTSALRRCLVFTLLWWIFFIASVTSLMLCRRSSMKLVRPPVFSVSSICGTNTSSVVRGLQPKSSSKGVMVEESERFGIIRSIQQAEATYSSHLVGHVLQISDRTSCIQAPARSTLP